MVNLEVVISCLEVMRKVHLVLTRQAAHQDRLAQGKLFVSGEINLPCMPCLA